MKKKYREPGEIVPQTIDRDKDPQVEFFKDGKGTFLQGQRLSG
jgi:hypothetical protein